MQAMQHSLYIEYIRNLLLSAVAVFLSDKRKKKKNHNILPIPKGQSLSFGLLDILRHELSCRPYEFSSFNPLVNIHKKLIMNESILTYVFG
jgi:hypothetical protein